MTKNWSIVKIAREIIALAIIFFLVSTALNYFRAPKLDSDTLPVIKVTLIDGTAFNTASIEGKPLLINFWGTWCPVCATEASNIEALSKNYRVITVAVNSGSNENIAKWMREHDVIYPVLNDTSGVWADRFKVSIYPTTFIYDKSGKLKFTETGYSTTAGLVARMKLAQ